MAEFPYSTNPASVKRLITRLSDVGVPPKVDFKYLTGIGFNDKTILRVIKSLGFVDSSGAPTERWTRCRNKDQAPQIVAEAIKAAYPKLFETYPDAYRRDDKDLQNLISTNSKVASGTLEHIVRTFKTLCSLADFEGVTTSSADMREKETGQSQRMPPATDRPLTVNINIQLQVPATEDASIYDKLFEALKKHFP